MLLLWDLYWPALAAALIIGVLAGLAGFRGRTARNKKLGSIAAGIVATLVAAALWHWPLGAGERFAKNVETIARTALVDWEMSQVQAQIDSRPMTRTLLLSGPADNFQRGELVRIMESIPGVAQARWTDSESGFEPPLIAEVELWALVAFGLGLLLSYLIELRRRARAEWRW